MATLQDSDIQDLATSSLKRLGRLRFQQIAQRYTNYEVFMNMFKRGKVEFFPDGIGIQRSIMIDHSEQAKQVGLHENDDIDIKDVLVTIDVPWRHTTVGYGFERREALVNRGESRIAPLLKVRRTDALLSLVEHVEDQFWTFPTGGSTNKLDLFGIPYWIIANNTTGFNGTNHTDVSAGPGNLSASTYPRWANYTAQWTTLDRTETTGAVWLMRKAYRQIRFKSPVSVPDYARGGTRDRYKIYTNENNIMALETVGEGQNESLGLDLAPMDGVMAFRKIPIIYVPFLDNFDGTIQDPKNPIYMLDTACIFPAFLRGDYLRETEPFRAPNQHNTWQIHIDLTWQLMCIDRRRQAVIAEDVT